MKYIQLFFVILTCAYAGNRLPVTITPRDGAIIPVNTRPADSATINTTLIATCGDIRAVLGGGRNMIVCRHGNALATIYGAPTGNSNNPMCIKVAYSVNSGSSWTSYGPWTGNIRRPYPSCDGKPDFCTNPGEHIFIYSNYTNGALSFPISVIIGQGTPYGPSPSVPIDLPGSDSLCIWYPGIAYAPDSLYIIAWGWSYLPSGNNHFYLWFSLDGGYTWSAPIAMGMGSNPNYGGNSGPRLRMGTNGYAAGIYIAPVGGIINDGWPHFIESTNGGQTWLSPVELPVPHFDSMTGQFWWNEIDVEVIDDKPWVIANDLNGGFWLFEGDGTPGARTWTAYDLGVIGNCAAYIGDTLFQIVPSQYGSISHDPVSGMILCTYKASAYVVQDSSNVIQNGPCVGGVFTLNEGITWGIAHPLSDYTTTIPWGDWNATETAYLLANVNDTIIATSWWIHSTNYNLYLERGKVKPITMNISENQVPRSRVFLKLSPSVSSGPFLIDFNITQPGTVDLTLFDATGRQAAELFNGSLTAGPHTVAADIRRKPAGIYFVALEIYGRVLTKKILLVH